MDAKEGRRRFLARYECPSIWETQEVYEHLVDLTIDTDDMADYDYGGATPGLLTPKACPASSAGPVPDCVFGGTAPGCQAPKAGAASSPDPDADKPRATVLQYGALIGEEVACHLGGGRPGAGGEAQAPVSD